MELFFADQLALFSFLCFQNRLDCLLADFPHLKPSALRIEVVRCHSFTIIQNRVLNYLIYILCSVLKYNSIQNSNTDCFLC